MDSPTYSDIGDLLAKARKEHGLSLQEADRALHIRAHYLKALEEGNLDAIPGPIYVKGYLQSYAAFLGLDKEEILRRFEQLDVAGRGFFLPQVFSKEKTPGPWLVRGSIAAAVFIYLFWLVALRPGSVPISVVEPFPQPEAEKAHISAAMIEDVPCLRPQETLYPPCTTARRYPVGREAVARDLVRNFIKDPALRLPPSLFGLRWAGRRPQD